MRWNWSSFRACATWAMALKSVVPCRAKDVKWLVPSSSLIGWDQPSFLRETGSMSDPRHIGLATVTYHFDGQVMHRDSEGNAREITLGAMIADVN